MDNIREKVLDKGVLEFVLRISELMQNTTVLNETKQMCVILYTVLGSRTLKVDARDQRSNISPEKTWSQNMTGRFWS